MSDQLRTVKTGRNLFYVYVLRDPRDQSLFYVGCTRRPLERSLMPSGYSPKVAVRLAEILANGHRPIRQVFCVVGTAEQAGYQERHAVESLRARGCVILNDMWGGFYGRVKPRRKAPLRMKWDTPTEAA